MDIIETLTLKFPRDGAGTIYGWDRRGERTKHRAGGYGYSKCSSVLASWITKDHQELLKPLRRKCASTFSKKAGFKYRGGDDSRRDGKLYGSTYYRDEDRVGFDGACGMGSLESFLAAAGLALIRVGSTKETETYLLVRLHANDSLWGYEKIGVQRRKRREDDARYAAMREAASA